jgi:hypothetical protein
MDLAAGTAMISRASYPFKSKIGMNDSQMDKRIHSAKAEREFMFSRPVMD